MPDPARQFKAVNIWTARIVPILLIALTGYVTYAIVVSVCSTFSDYWDHRVASLTIQQSSTYYMLDPMPLPLALARLLPFSSFTSSYSPLWP